MSDSYRPRRSGLLVRSVLAGTICLAAAVPFAGSWGATGAGNRAFHEADHRAAADWHALAARLAMTDRWIPAYNRGVAAHGARSWVAAAEHFAAAAETAPAEFQCRVRLNWAWTLEAQADELESAGDRAAAVPLWGQASQVLVEANCSDEDAEPSPQPSEPDDAESQDPEQQPSEQPEQEPSEDPADPGEPDGSEAEQQQETLERLEEKATGPQRPSDDGEEQEATMDPEEALQQREQQAARERAEAQEPMPAPGGEQGEGGRTW